MRRIAVLCALEKNGMFDYWHEFPAGMSEAAWTFYRAQEDLGRDVVAIHAEESILNWTVDALTGAAR